MQDELGWSRNKSTAIMGVSMVALGSLSSLGYGPLANVTILGMQFLDFFDFLTNSVMMPIAAIASCILVSRVIGVDRIAEEVTLNGGTFRRRKIFNVMIRFVPFLRRNHSHQLHRQRLWLDLHVNAHQKQKTTPAAPQRES